MPLPKTITLRTPLLEDGMSVFRLIQRCPPLDTNSSYCNLLQCGHFSNSSVAACQGNELLGFISGYPLVERPDTLFIWQVAVDEQARGLGLASHMLMHILERSTSRGYQYIETTITADNQPSWALFKRLAKQLGAEFQSAPWMDKQTHFDGLHDSESLIRIGPFNLENTRDIS